MSLQVLSERNVEAAAVDWDHHTDRPRKWWRTAPLTVNSWAYTPDNDDKKPITRIPPHSYLAFHPLAAHIVSSNDDAGSDNESDGWRLDSGLVGVKTVEDSIQCYEKAVGFHYTSFPEIDHADWGLPPPLNLAASEQEVSDSNKAWSVSLKEFISAIQEMSLADNEGSLSNSFIESEPSSGSDNSTEFFAMPSTPVHKDAHLPDVLVKSLSPNGSINDDVVFSTPARTKTLNAYASSFVPSFSPPAHTGTFSYTSITDSLKEKTRRKPVSRGSKSPPPSLSSFTFPTLNPPTKSTTRLTTVKIKKDDQGFFTDVQVDNTAVKIDHAVADSLLLPPFLQEPAPRRRPRVSRTREMVDRLRSSQSETPAVLDDAEAKKATLDFPFDLLPKSASLSPSPILHDGPTVRRPRSSLSEDGGNRGRETELTTPSQDDDDDEGWIDVAHSATPSTVSNAKRARDLFLAFTRRRTDSTSSEPMKEPVSAELPSAKPGQSVDANQNGEQRVRSAPPKNARHANRDGWIDGHGQAPSGVTVEVKPFPLPPKPNSTPLVPPPSSKPGHRKKSSSARQPGSASSLSGFNPARPAFSSPTNPAYLNVPLMTPSSHMNIMPPPSPFFFSTGAPGYHPSMPVAFAPVGFVSPPPYGLPPPTPYLSPPATHAVSMASQHHRKGSLSAW